MKILFTFIFTAFIHYITLAQTVVKNQELVLMSDTHQKAYKLESMYYKSGTNTPFTGILYSTYDNGNYQTLQEYVNGVGKGKWVDYNPDGIKECEGTYKDNRVEGPVTFYYENGSVKSKGQYLHWKKPIGLWQYYDQKGNLVHTMTYTR